MSLTLVFGSPGAFGAGWTRRFSMGPPAGFYVRVQVHGELGPTWSAVFADLTVEPGAEGTTLISGELPDQAAFHGLLAAIRDLGLSLISVETLATPATGAQSGGT